MGGYYGDGEELKVERQKRLDDLPWRLKKIDGGQGGRYR
jgi:hypothetical protein